MNNLKKKKRIETSASIQLRLTLSQCGGKGCQHPAKCTQTKIMFFLCTWMMRMMIFSGGAEDDYDDDDGLPAHSHQDHDED